MSIDKSIFQKTEEDFYSELMEELREKHGVGSIPLYVIEEVVRINAKYLATSAEIFEAMGNGDFITRHADETDDEFRTRVLDKMEGKK